MAKKEEGKLYASVMPTDSIYGMPTSTNSSLGSGNKAIAGRFEGDYTPVEFQTSDETKSYYDRMQGAESKLDKYGNYSYANQGIIDNLLGKISEGFNFSYDFNADPLYQQYKDNYTKLGNDASMNAVANASALTGGYGSSYATTAAAQANQQYMTQLNDVIPQLADAALEKYKLERADLYNQYGVYTDDKNTDYGMWTDQRNFLMNNRDYYANQYNNMYNNDLNKAQFDQSERQFDAGFDLDKWTANENASQFALQFNENVRQFGLEYALKQAQLSKSSGKGGGKSSGSSTTPTTTTNKEQEWEKAKTLMDGMAGTTSPLWLTAPYLITGMNSKKK